MAGKLLGLRAVIIILNIPKKKGLVAIPHPQKDVPIGTVNSILKQAGLKD
ncbi:type II toxin-antitoxin system HicA family toxin [Aequorivita ciconiae]|nr:type II toxin-antitoxin system HicA family toxin [Aequorivita sp. H23M31]